jgi:phosphate-selective porin OprO/OprP
MRESEPLAAAALSRTFQPYLGKARSDGMSLSRTILFSSTAVCIGLTAAPAVHAQSVVQMQQQIEVLKQQLQQLLERQQRVEADAQKSKEDAAKAATDARVAAEASQKTASGWTITAKDNRPRLTSPDGDFSVGLTSRIHFDVGHYFQPGVSNGDTRQFPHLSDGYNLRRGRIGVLGTFYRDWDFNLTYDLGGTRDNVASINEASISFTGLRPLKLQAGYVDTNYDFANGMTSNTLPFLEAPTASNLVGNLSGGTRAVFGGNLPGERYFAELYYAGSAAGTHVNGDQAGAFGRVAYRPYQTADAVIHIGANGSYVFQTNQDDSQALGARNQVEFFDRPELRVDPTALIDTTNGKQFINARSAFTGGLELAGAYQRFWTDAGYYWYGAKQAPLSGPAPDLLFSAYYGEVGMFLTDDKRPYDNGVASWGYIRPSHPFSLATGDIGAIEVAVRYSYANLNDHVVRGLPSAVTGGIFGGKQGITTIGLNWYPNYNVRVMLDYYFATVDKLRPTDGKTEIGQSFQAIAMRTQMQF